MAFPRKLTGTLDEFCKAIAQRESSNNPTIINSAGFMGLYQFGEAALIDLKYLKSNNFNRANFDNKLDKSQWTGKDGVFDTYGFLRRPDIQTKAFQEMIIIRIRRINRLGLYNFVNKTIDGVYITLSGLVAGAHLVGEGGLRDWLVEGRPIKDGNGVHVKEYVSKFGGYKL